MIPTDTAQAEGWMRRAMELAVRGKGKTSPNPAVGAVIVKNGRVVGEGWHRKAGGPHAEVFALRQAGKAARGATAYVTLEPCNHTGRTGPCAKALIEAGVREVVIGARDISPKRGLRGAAALRRAGVKVTLSVLKAECMELCEDFFKHSATGLPHVTIKTAMTLDGKIAARSGDSRWISSARSRKLVHIMRSRVDAVMIGADTAIMDDPLLTVRDAPGRNPVRALVDGRLRAPVDGKLARSARHIPTIILTTTKHADGAKAALWRKAGADVLAAGEGERVDLSMALAALGLRNIMSVLVESGGALAWELVRTGLADRALFFIAPIIAGGPRCAMGSGGVEKIAQAYKMVDMRARMCGEDILVEGRFLPRGA